MPVIVFQKLCSTHLVHSLFFWFHLSDLFFFVVFCYLSHSWSSYRCVALTGSELWGMTWHWTSKALKEHWFTRRVYGSHLVFLWARFSVAWLKLCVLSFSNAEKKQCPVLSLVQVDHVQIFAKPMSFILVKFQGIILCKYFSIELK